MTNWTFYDIKDCPGCDQGLYANVPTPLCGKPSFWQTCCLNCGTRGGKGKTRAEAVELWNKWVATMRCEKCALLAELYERTPKSPRDYYAMTELFVLLHGSDVCESGKKKR